MSWSSLFLSLKTVEGSHYELVEKTLLKQRLVNLSAGQGGYVEKQKKALANN